MTYREGRYVAERIKGATKQQALLAAGFSAWIARIPQEYETDEMREAVELAQKELAAAAIEDGLVSANEIHEYLTQAVRSDMRDIRNDDGSFKPQSEWPEIWGRMMEAGDVDVEYASERSHDGETKDQAGGWDRVGTVVKVKLKFASKTKLLELAMKHVAVNAMVQEKHGDVNILVVTAEKARQVVSAKKRLAKVIPTVESEPK